jgi:exonuclease III
MPLRRLLFWILILAALCNWPTALANTHHTSTLSFSTPITPTTTPPIPPLRTRTTPANQARTPASLRQPDDPENTNHGDCLDDYLDLADQGKAFQEVDPGQSTPSKAVWKEQILRIYFQNINGIRLDNDGADMLDIFLQMENIRADIFAFAETKLASDQPFVANLLQRNKRKIWDHARIVTSTSTVVLEGYHKPGGTLTCAANSLVGRIQRTFSDPYGRWSGMELMGRSNKRLVVLTVYQVPQKTGSSGSTTAYTQQRNMFRLEGRSNPNPRKILIEDLRTLVSDLRSNGHDIILMGDFNEHIGLDPHGMASVLLAGGLIDSHVSRHGIETEPSTYARGHTRVDYMFLSERLKPHILRAGIEPFNQRIFADHRGMFIDLSLPGLFDRSLTTLASPANRHLCAINPKHVQKYIRELHAYLQQHLVLQRLEEIKTNADHPSAEAIDQDITRAMLHAELQCKSFNRLPWSHDLHAAMTTLYILKMQLTQIRTQRDMQVQIGRRQQQLIDPVLLPASISEANSALRSARRRCREIATEARALRKTREDERLAAFQMANSTQDPNKLEHLFIRAQETKEMFRRLPSIKPKSSGGLSMVKIPDPETADPKTATKWTTITDPLLVEQKILARNQRHFAQAAPTPLATPEIQRLLSFGGTSSIADQLLYQNYDPSLLTPSYYGQQLLAKCSTSVTEITPDITLDEMQQKYRCWPERTSTSPSGRHLSHYHALLKPDGSTSADDDYEALDGARKDVWFAHHAILQYSIRHGYCFKRWHQVVNAMIEKEPGDPRIHRLRVIHLYEADYSLLLGVQFRRLMHHCEDNNLLNPGCYGCRAARTAHDPLVIEVLQMDYTFATRHPHIKFSNDATSCFDRIIPSVSSIISRSYGLHRNIAHLQGSMLNNAVYRIKTQLGISDDSYSHSDEHPVFGTGQGSSSSPSIWTLVCSSGFDIYDTHCYGATYTSPDRTKLLKLGMTGFVDDNNAQTTGRPDESEKALALRCTHDAQLWHDILWATGGALETTKCSYQSMRFDFSGTGTPYLRHGKHGPPIVIQDAQGEDITITQLPVTQAYKILGTYQAAVASQRQQHTVLLQKATDHCRTLALSNVSKRGAWIYYSSVFLRSVGYPLGVCHLTTSQLESLQGPMVSTTLQKMGYNSRMSRKATYGPTKYGGLDFRDLKIEQGVESIRLLMRHLRIPGQPQQMLLITLDQLQHNSGLGTPLLEFPDIRAPHLEGLWIPQIRKFLQRIHGSLRIADLTIQPLQRYHDYYIMDAVVTCPSLSPSDVKRINYCRLYLQVLTLSDMSNATGDRLAPGIRHGQHLWSQSKTTIQEIHQERPNEASWTIWRRFLNTIANFHGYLLQPLGTWLQPAATLRRLWPFLYSPSSDSLYVRSSTQYDIHPFSRTQIYSYDLSFSVQVPPDDGIPVDCSATADGWRIPGSLAVIPPTISPGLSPTFDAYIDQQPDHIAALLPRLNWYCQDVFDFCDQAADLSAILLVTDGGAANNMGSFGWIIGTLSGTRLASGSGPVFGFDPRSYRAETYGCRAGMTFVQLAFQYCRRPMKGTLSVSFDNQGLLKKQKAFQKFALAKYSAALHSEWDAIIAVYHLMQHFPQLPELNHVYGHQDLDIDYADLPLDAQMNTQADALATMELDEFSTLLHSVPFDPESRVMLSIDGTTVTRRLETTMRTKASLPGLITYYQERLHWDEQTFHAVDWETFGSVYPKMNKRRNFITKFCFFNLPTGDRLHRRNPSYDDRCPTCHLPNEKDDHILQCPSPARRAWRSDLIQTILKPIDSFLDPVLIDILREGLLRFFQDEILDPDPYPLRYQRLLKQQRFIGWNNLLRGKFSEEWKYLQEQHCTRQHRKMNNKQRQWMTKLLRTLWIRIHDLWLARNDDRHGSTNKAKSQASQQQAQRTIRALYLLKDLVLSEDRDLFYDSIEAHLQQPLRELNAWITTHQGLIAYSVRVAKLAARSNTKPITEHFTILKNRQRRQIPTSVVLPEPTHYRNTKLTNYITVTRPNTRSKVKRPQEPLERRPILRQRSLHHLWPDPLG